MSVFDRMAADGYEQVVHCHDGATGLRAIIAVHSTACGPALGGTRFYPFPDEDAALTDVLRLAKGMTYKNAVSGLALGGGKAVIIGDPKVARTEELIRTYARFVDSLHGRYLTAEDVGTTQADMDLIRQETPYVTGTSAGLGGSGDPSPATAWGVLNAMRAVAAQLWGSDSLAGRRIVVIGVGKVGGALVGHLVEDGAKVVVADVDRARVEAALAHPGVEAVATDDALTVECDVLSPCALGGLLNATTIPRLRCAAVVGAANNQLAETADADRLADRGVLYAPDYVANAGGVINIADELHGYHHDRAWARVAGIRDTMAAVLVTAEAEGITPEAAADRIAERRIATAAQAGPRIRTFPRGPVP